MHNIPHITTSHQTRKRLQRAQPKTVAGVCAGIAAHFEIQALWVQIGFTLLTLAGGIGFLCYIAAWLLLPAVDQTAPTHSAKERNVKLAGAALLAISSWFIGNSFLSSGFIFFTPNPWNFTSLFLPALFFAGGVLLLAHTQKDKDHLTPNQPTAPINKQRVETPPTSTPTDPKTQTTQTITTIARRRRSWRSAFIGFGGLLLATVCLLVIVRWIPELRGWKTFSAATVILTGATVVIRSFFGKAAGFSIIGLMLAMASCSVAAVDVSLSKLTEQHAGTAAFTFQAKDERKTYDRSVGNFTAEVNVAGAKTPANLDLNVGVGDLTVLAPDNVEIRTTATTLFGTIHLPNNIRKDKNNVGTSIDNVLTPSKTDKPVRKVLLNLDVAVGDIFIQQVGSRMNKSTPPVEQKQHRRKQHLRHKHSKKARNR